jgi:hypothetical protein
MGRAVKIRGAMLGKTELRLSQQDGRFYGLIDGKIVVNGDSADDVWRRLHDEADKSNPKYFGFDGARNRFLHFFSLQEASALRNTPRTSATTNREPRRR